jgi:hypothetical protein
MTPEELDKAIAEFNECLYCRDWPNEAILEIALALREAWAEREELEKHLDLCHTEGLCVYNHRKTMEAIRAGK